jgi:hypothetical protein
MSRPIQSLHTNCSEPPVVVVSRPAAAPKPEGRNDSTSYNDRDCDQQDFDDGDSYDYDYQDYGDDYCLNNQKPSSSGGGGGNAGRGCNQKTTKRQNQRGGGGGRKNIYSSKHVRLQAAISKK